MHPGATLARLHFVSSVLQNLQLPQHILRRAHLKLPRLFQVKLFHHAVFKHHGVALPAYAHAARGEVLFNAHGFGHQCAAVGHHAHPALRLAFAAPCGHGGRVVHRYTPYFVDAFGLELVDGLHETGQVTLRSGLGEGRGHAE